MTEKQYFVRICFLLIIILAVAGSQAAFCTESAIPEQEKKPGENTAAQNNDFAQISDHLGYLEYKCTLEQEGSRLRCVTEKSDPNLTIKKQSNGYLIRSSYISSEYAKKNKPPFLDAINNFNSIAIATRYYADEEIDFIMELWLPGGYRKDDFSNAIKYFNYDFEQIKKKYKKELDQFLK
jgi:hypothetical protein